MTSSDGRPPADDQQRFDLAAGLPPPKGGLPRWADLVVATIGLALVSPLLAAAAIAIKLESRGPVFYRQRRVGKDGEVFEMFKLRTMRRGADPIGVGTAVTAGDPRVTRVGRLLRRYSLDELPNLINVLKGDMRIVGPRATLPAQVELYTPRQRRRLDLRPGVTGWAQIHGRAGIPWEERIELDVWYVEHRSPWLDLRILARTPAALLGGAGGVAHDPYAGSSADSPLRQAAEREREQARER
jgi:lipopolysaccharide/colanic/teichoic acid biosynthesis glycosyltransferase